MYCRRFRLTYTGDGVTLPPDLSRPSRVQRSLSAPTVHFLDSDSFFVRASLSSSSGKPEKLTASGKKRIERSKRQTATKNVDRG